MKREIHWYYYPGGLQVSLVITTEENEKWQPMKIIPVAFLPSPMTKSYGEWLRQSTELTAEEKDIIKTQARINLKEWIRWSLNPNNEKGLYENDIEEQTAAIMQLVPQNYIIKDYKGYENYKR